MPRGIKKTEADYLNDIEKALTGLAQKVALFQAKIEEAKKLYANPAAEAEKKSPKAKTKAKK